MPRPTLMLVTDRALCGGADALALQVAAAIAGGVNVVQVREKDLADAELLALTRRIVAVAAGRAGVLVNGRPAVARAAGAQGVHGGEDARPIAAERAEAGARLLIGRSVHGLAAARAAAAAGADYLVLGTIFPSRSHPGGETGGLARVREVAQVVAPPVIAIGGITTVNAAAVIQAGAAGVAVISAILGRPDPEAAARVLRGALDAAGVVAWPAPAHNERDAC